MWWLALGSPGERDVLLSFHPILHPVPPGHYRTSTKTVFLWQVVLMTVNSVCILLPAANSSCTLCLYCFLLHHYIPMLFMSSSKIHTVVDHVSHLRGCDNVWGIEKGRSISTIREKLWMGCWRLQVLLHFIFQAWKSCYLFFSMWRYMSCTYLPQLTLRPNFEQEWGCLKWHREADGCVGVWPVEFKRCR